MARQNFIDPPHELSKLVSKAIERHLSATGKRINADVYDKAVVLTGTVSSWYQKQIAQESVLGIESVECVDNRIRVDYSDDEFDPISDDLFTQ